MAEISKIKVKNQEHTIKDATARAGLLTKSNLSSDVHHNYYVKGTQTATTGAWTGNLPEVDALYEGLTIDYWLPFPGNGNATLNLTLKDGSTTGAVNCYIQGTTRVTTHIPATCICRLIYQTYSLNGTDYTGWWMVRAYYVNDTAGLLRLSNTNYVADSKVNKYQIIFQMDEDRFTPLNNNDSIGTDKTMLTDVQIDPFGIVAYWNSNSAVNANTNISSSAIYYQVNLDLRYTFNTGTTLTAQKNVYLKLIILANGKAKLASASPIVQELPSTKDGYYYMFLGRTYSTYQMMLYPEHPVYYHDGMQIREYKGSIDARSYMVNEKVTMQWNDTDESLDFVFA